MKKFIVIFSMLGLSAIGLMGCQQANDLQTNATKSYNDAAATVDGATKTAITAKETAERKVQEIQDAAAKVQEANEAIGQVMQ